MIGGIIMKVLVIGIGAVGAVLSKFLVDDKIVDSVICGDVDLERAKKFLNFKSTKIKLVYLDANSTNEIISVAKGVDLIINTALPKLNLQIMQAALKVGANYQDLCSHLDKENVPEQLKLNSQFKKSGLIGLINTGMAPGVTNIIAKSISLMFDEIDLIKIRTLQDQISINPIFALSPEIIMEEAMQPAIKFENGKFLEVKQFSEFEDFEFDKGFSRFVYSVYGDEISTLSKNIKAKKINFMAGGTDIESSKAIFDLGLLTTEPITINGVKIIPLDIISQVPIDVPTPADMSEMIKTGVFKDSNMVVAVEMIGKKFDKKIRVKSLIQFHSAKEINALFEGANYISFSTGLSAYCFFRVISKIKGAGVFPPELLEINLINSILFELVSNGLSIKQIIG